MLANKSVDCWLTVGRLLADALARSVVSLENEIKAASQIRICVCMYLMSPSKEMGIKNFESSRNIYEIARSKGKEEESELLIKNNPH